MSVPGHQFRIKLDVLIPTVKQLTIETDLESKSGYECKEWNSRVPMLQSSVDTLRV